MISFGPPPAAQQAELRRRHGSQLRLNAGPITDFFFLNTTARPFDDIRVRRALNYAIDRRRVARIYGGDASAQPTCQILPPQAPGHQAYCPYTRGADADGHWHGPDLARARRLVAASGTRGMRVTVWNTRLPQVQYDESRYVVRALRRLGYAASLRLLPPTRYYDYTNDLRNRAQVVMGGWGLDYPAASSMLVKLTCGAMRAASPDNPNPSGHCDATTDRLVRRATTLQPTQPDRANALWARVDRRLTDAAIWLPTVTPRWSDITSTRVGNYHYHLTFGALVDALWVR